MIVKDVYINAPARLVYAFLTEPAKIAQLIGTEADVNPHPGGLFRIVATATDIIRGTYLEAVPDSKVTFTWGSRAKDTRSRRVRRSSKSRFIRRARELVSTSFTASCPPPGAPITSRAGDYCLARLNLVAEGGRPAPFSRPPARCKVLSNPRI